MLVTYFVKVVVDHMELGRLSTNVLGVGHAVEMNLVEDCVLGTLPAVLHSIDAVVEHLAAHTKVNTKIS